MLSDVAVFTLLKSIIANPFPAPVRERGGEEGKERKRDINRRRKRERRGREKERKARHVHTCTVSLKETI